LTNTVVEIGMWHWHRCIESSGSGFVAFCTIGGQSYGGTLERCIETLKTLLILILTYYVKKKIRAP